WGIRWQAYHQISVRTPLDWGVIWLVLMLLVTIWATALPEKTLPQIYRLLTGIGLYYTIVNWAIFDPFPPPGWVRADHPPNGNHSEKKIRLLYFGAILAGFGLALFAAISVEWSVDKFPFIPPSVYDRFLLLVSDTVHPNVIAGSMVILLPCALGLLFFYGGEMRWFAIVLLGGAALAMGGFLALTQSRGALIAFGAVCAAFVVLRWRWVWIAVLISGIGAGVIVQLADYKTVLDMVFSNRTLGGIEGRIEIWSRAIYMIQDFSFTGVGLGLFGDVADLLYPFFLVAPGRVSHAHNLFLQIGVDLGIPGLVAWLSLLMLVIVTAWQVYRYGRTQNDRWIAGVGAGLLCSQIALIVHGLTDAVTWGMVRPAPIVWGLWGITIAARQVYIKRGGKGL
ncbi:MAG: O-antigen ligase family protein, partial [Anaerolineales bacterium]